MPGAKQSSAAEVVLTSKRLFDEYQRLKYLIITKGQIDGRV
jgi:hypothetical protein